MNFELDVVVEIPVGSMYKYEVDKKTGQLTIDRPLPRPLPYSYGYIPNTIHLDYDPTDICIVGYNHIYPLTKAKVTLLGAYKCIDNGQQDDKLVGVIVGENYSDTNIEDFLILIKDYLSTYKEGFEVKEFVGPEEAYEIVMKDTHRYLNDGE